MHLGRLVLVVDRDESHVATGAALSKVCNTDPDGPHYTCPGVSGLTVTNRHAFDAVLLSSEEQADGAGGGTCVRVYVGGW